MAPLLSYYCPVAPLSRSVVPLLFDKKTRRVAEGSAEWGCSDWCAEAGMVTPRKRLGFSARGSASAWVLRRARGRHRRARLRRLPSLLSCNTSCPLLAWTPTCRSSTPMPPVPTQSTAFSWHWQRRQRICLIESESEFESDWNWNRIDEGSRLKGPKLLEG
jgi:hypothetical protein